MAPGPRKLRLRPAPPCRKPHLTRNVFFHARFFRRVELVPAPLFLAKWSHRAMPSPRGEDAELCSPDAVEASRLPPVPSGACLTSSLVCFCITCQAFFLSAEKPVSAPGAAPASRTNGRHGAPGRKPTPSHTRQPPRTGPIPATAGFPQSFPHFCRFSTAAFFPLGFLGERQRQIFRAVGSSCSVRHGMVRYCTVRLGTVPRDVASASRVTNLPERPPSTPGRTAGGRHRKPLRRLDFALPDMRYVNQFLPSVSNPVKWAISVRQNGTKNFLSVFFARILWFPLQISAQKEPPFRAALRHVCVRFSACVTPG